MTLYEYRCRRCGRIEPSERRGDDLGICWKPQPMVLLVSTGIDAAGRLAEEPRPASRPCMGVLTRVWGFQQAPGMPEHFNRSVGAVVSSHRQFERELRRASDEATERTGIEHRYVPVDPTDRRALGVTDAGLDATNRHRVAEGLKPVPLGE